MEHALILSSSYHLSSAILLFYRLKYALANDGALLDAVKIRPKTSTQQLSWADTMEFNDTMPVASPLGTATDPPKLERGSSHARIVTMTSNAGTGSTPTGILSSSSGRIRPQSAVPSLSRRNSGNTSAGIDYEVEGGGYEVEGGGSAGASYTIIAFSFV